MSCLQRQQLDLRQLVRNAGGSWWHPRGTCWMSSLALGCVMSCRVVAAVYFGSLLKGQYDGGAPLVGRASMAVAQVGRCTWWSPELASSLCANCRVPGSLLATLQALSSRAERELSDVVSLGAPTCCSRGGRMTTRPLSTTALRVRPQTSNHCWPHDTVW